MSANTSDVEEYGYQFGGDHVLTSSSSAGAWISATYPVDLTEAR